MKIGGQEILPGTHATVDLDLGRLPSGSLTALRTHVFRASQPGPTLLLSGGMHGDEVNGIEIVRRMIADKMFVNLIRGTVIAVPLMNVYGFINFSRAVPDGKDLNRSFPGTISGSLAARVARIICEELLPPTDLGIDFHCGGANRYNYPQIRFSPTDPEARRYAEFFSAPFLVEMKSPSGSLRKVAQQEGTPILIYEGGESLRLDEQAVNSALQGTVNLLVKLQMLDLMPSAKELPSLLCHKTTWIRASESGIFLRSKGSGAPAVKGEVLGNICDPFGQWSKKIVARKNGYIIGHNNTPVVYPGDALFHLAEPVDPTANENPYIFQQGTNF
jgi:predicted deacylase